jgi:hypothetical protein
MAATPRELVLQTLNFEGPARAPRQLWWLPWAEIYHPAELAEIRAAFPTDIEGAPGFLREPAFAKGDSCEPGVFIDDWGAEFVNIQRGVVGEVKNPLIRDWAADVERVHVPREWLSVDTDKVNEFCADSDKFIMAGCCPRPFEQMQFLRGTADFYLDLLMQPPEMAAFLAVMHNFYCDQMELWAKTDVDALMFMDDWGSQQSLLIDPALWRDVFKPLYRDYIQIAHGAGKKIFMHSDGHTLDIYPDLVELGLDAFNSQLFCMGVDKLEPFAGKITFWGEIDRQHLLPEGSAGDIRQAVEQVYQTLWKNGGCIAQCEFGAAANPGNVREVFAHWDRLAGL